MFLKFLFMYINAEARLWLDSRASSLCFLTLKNQFLSFVDLFLCQIHCEISSLA